MLLKGARALSSMAQWVLHPKRAKIIAKAKQQDRQCKVIWIVLIIVILGDRAVFVRHAYMIVA